MAKYITIPQSLIENSSLDDKRIIAFVAILYSKWDGSDYEALVHSSCYYSGFRGRNGILNQYKSLVEFYIKNGYLDRGMLNISREKPFAKISHSEIKRIFKLRESLQKEGKRINHAVIFLVLAYIRSHMTNDYYSDFVSRAAQKLNISSRSFTQVLGWLERLEIIHSEQLPRYKTKDGAWHSNVSVFVNMEEDGKLVDWKSKCEQAVKCVRREIFKRKI